MSYNAFVTRLTNVRPHPGADRLKLATACNCQVVVGLGAIDGDIGIFFPEGGCLSHEFCLSNNLYSKSARQQLGLPESEQVGFFDKNRRIRAQSFRGARSEGFFTSLSCLDYLGEPATVALQPGTELNAIGTAVFCEKYITRATRQGAESQRSTRRGEALGMPKHVDTKAFRYYADTIPPGAVITITEKLHGTSGRLGCCLEQESQSWWRRLLRLPVRRDWRFLNGSRNVILEQSTGVGFYGDDSFRLTAVAGVQPRKGEALYFELVGYTHNGQEIMPSHEVPKELPELRALIGETAHFHYGCPPGVVRLFVYRITQSDEDGNPVELSWPQVKARCRQLGLAHVPELQPSFFTYPDNEQGMTDLQMVVAHHTEGISTLDPTGMREGCVLRIDAPDGTTTWLKSKAYAFGVLEGYIKLQDDYVDKEEAS